MLHLTRCLNHCAFRFRQKISRGHSSCPPMLPNLLVLSTIIFSILLCTVVPREQSSRRHHASRRGRSVDRFAVLPLHHSTLLQPRVPFPPYLMGPDWIVDHHDFTCMLPIHTAAAIMQDFYEDLVAYAATTLTPTSCCYHLRLGQLLLEVVAPPKTVVEWILVQHFALTMLRLTKSGYTNTYQINFIHRPTGMLVTFSLYTGVMR